MSLADEQSGSGVGDWLAISEWALRWSLAVSMKKQGTDGLVAGTSHWDSHGMQLLCSEREHTRNRKQPLLL